MIKILVSNDDGVHAPGIQALSEHLQELGEVLTVAPDRNCSGASHALTLHQPLRLQHLSNGFISVNGTPADCVHLALRQLCQDEPHIVVSGINAGANLGDDVLYSGTVASAMEGRFLQMPALALSLVGTQHYQTAAQVAVELVQKLLAKPLTGTQILNVNVPDVPYDALKGMQVTRLGARNKANNMIREQDPAGRDIYWIGPPGQGTDTEEGTDFHAIKQGYVSVTPLSIDATAHQAVDTLNAWFDSE
tara:strand:- start:1275 stop:2018 length:744 start_codon:yes stop_codon:yes gene_type:complete